MKIILLKNSNDPDTIEIVKNSDSKNLVFESYQELDDWCIINDLENNDSYLPVIIDRPSLRLDKVVDLHNNKLKSQTVSKNDESNDTK